MPVRIGKVSDKIGVVTITVPIEDFVLNYKNQVETDAMSEEEAFQELDQKTLERATEELSDSKVAQIYDGIKEKADIDQRIIEMNAKKPSADVDFHDLIKKII